MPKVALILTQDMPPSYLLSVVGTGSTRSFLFAVVVVIFVYGKTCNVNTQLQFGNMYSAYTKQETVAKHAQLMHLLLTDTLVL